MTKSYQQFIFKGTRQNLCRDKNFIENQFDVMIKKVLRHLHLKTSIKCLISYGKNAYLNQ